MPTLALDDLADLDILMLAHQETESDRRRAGSYQASSVADKHAAAEDMPSSPLASHSRRGGAGLEEGDPRMGNGGGKGGAGGGAGKEDGAPEGGWGAQSRPEGNPLVILREVVRRRGPRRLPLCIQQV